MQPPWMSGASSPLPSVGTAQTLAIQVQPLAAHVAHLEHALTSREWWLLGRAIPEAQVLSELSSLLAVARAELEGLLGQRLAEAPPDDGQDAVADDEHHLLNDPGWVQARREEAVALLSHAMSVLPGLLQFTQQSLLLAGRTSGPSSLLEGLEIARDRLREACEAVQLPPG